MLLFCPIDAAKILTENIVAKKKNAVDFGNVTANVSKICKRFKKVWKLFATFATSVFRLLVSSAASRQMELLTWLSVLYALLL